MAAQITVPYVEMTDPPDEGSDDQGGYAVKVYGVLWVNRLQFARDVMGYSSMSGGIIGSWNRKFPLQYPDDPNLFARSCKVSPDGAWIQNTTPLQWEKARVAVTFRAPTWSYSPQSDDPLFLNSFTQDPVENQALAYCTQTLRYATEYDQLPIHTAVDSAGNKYKTPISVPTMVATMVLSYHDYPNMPLAKIFQFSDVLNDDTFLGRPRGTVILKGADSDRKRQADGTVTLDVSITLKTRKNDWNMKLEPDGSWDYIYLRSVANPTPPPATLPDTSATILPYVNMRGLLLSGSGT